MGRGRPPKPAAQKALEGDKGKGRRPALEDMPLSGVPELPNTIDAVAADHFTRVASELNGIGAVKRIDTEALSMLGELWSDFWHAAEKLRAAEKSQDLDGMKFYRDLKYKAHSSWATLAAKFYLTPVDRLKVVAAGQAPKVDPREEEFIIAPLKIAR
jgi:phage terminase small subunit